MPAPDGVDPDVDLSDPAQVEEIRPHEWDVLLAIAVGGVVGGEARYGLARAVPHDAGSWPWSTLITNAAGCLLIGMLMVVLHEIATPHRLARPLLGVGVLGGFTTFSTFAVEADQLMHAHRPAVALAYVAASLAVCLAAVIVGTGVTRRARVVRVSR